MIRIVTARGRILILRNSDRISVVTGIARDTSVKLAGIECRWLHADEVLRGDRIQWNGRLHRVASITRKADDDSPSWIEARHAQET